MERKGVRTLSIGERIKKLRKALDLTQAEFGEKIGSTQNAIGNYETGHRNPSSSVINNICKTFDVSEKWLRTGEGEMLIPKSDAALMLLACERDLTMGDLALIEKFLNLKPESRKVILDYALEAAKAVADMEADGFSPDTYVSPTTELSGIPVTDSDIKKHSAAYEEMAQDEAYSTLQQAGVDPDIDAQVEAYRQRLLNEKKRASQTSAVKERGAG